MNRLLLSSSDQLEGVLTTLKKSTSHEDPHTGLWYNGGFGCNTHSWSTKLVWPFVLGGIFCPRSAGHFTIPRFHRYPFGTLQVYYYNTLGAFVQMLLYISMLTDNLCGRAFWSFGVAAQLGLETMPTLSPAMSLL